MEPRGDIKKRGYNPVLDKERRHGRDLLFSLIRWLSVLGWSLMMASLFLLAYAKPGVETFFDRWYNVTLRRAWDTDLARAIFYCMLLGLVLSLIGLAINVLRHRRRNDEYRISLILLGLLSLSGLIMYLVSF